MVSIVTVVTRVARSCGGLPRTSWSGGPSALSRVSCFGSRPAGQDDRHRDGGELDVASLANEATHATPGTLGVLIDDGEQTQLSAVVGRLADEVVGPDVVAMLGPEADARSVVQPEATALGLSGGYFQALSTPDALAICSRPVMRL